MAKYLVNWERHVPPFNLLPGDVVELTDEQRDYLMGDSYGVITLLPDDAELKQADTVEVEVPAPPAEGATADGVAALDAAPSDRMVRVEMKRDRRQLDRADDPTSGSAGAIDKSSFKAVKDGGI